MVSAMPRSNQGFYFLILIGLSLAAIGSLFTILMGKSYLRAKEMRSWPQAEAVILSSEIEEWRHDPYSPMQYRLNLLYGYQWQGEALTAERLSTRGNPWTNKRDAIEKQLATYPEGRILPTYIRPDDPSFTILKPDSLAPGYSIWFPMLFVVGGIGIAVRSVLRVRFS